LRLADEPPALAPIAVQKGGRHRYAYFGWDSFSNFLAGFGIFGRDKARSQQPILNVLDRGALDSLYRGDWVSRKIVDVPAFDCTRAWRSWQAEEDQIEKLEETERQFGLQRKLLLALSKARLYGGSVIILGVNQGTFQDELDPDRVKKGDLKFVHVLDRWSISAGPAVRDVTSAWYGQPSYYYRANMPTPPSSLSSTCSTAGR
jgi:phage-related protein (TIGR01555 family)